VKANKTIHTSRTIMFAELAKVMNHAIQYDNYLDALNQNVINKKTKSGNEKTSGYLKRLYDFDINYPPFKALKYFWSISEERDKSFLALLYAIGNDCILADSISVIQGISPMQKVTIELLEDNIEAHNPNKYSANTRRSMAQNIASSWKQAGFIEGKVKNIRTQPEITYLVGCFAFLLAWLKGDRGDFIWNSTVVTALCLSESKLRNLAIECAKRDLMQYQYAGSVTAISFIPLLNKIGIDGI
jgi:hypothetical protein